LKKCKRVATRTATTTATAVAQRTQRGTRGWKIVVKGGLSRWDNKKKKGKKRKRRSQKIGGNF
jgi:hypothetical protein